MPRSSSGRRARLKRQRYAARYRREALPLPHCPRAARSTRWWARRSGCSRRTCRRHRARPAPSRRSSSGSRPSPQRPQDR
eukprot:scaffold21230_cov60-Phaeocystis_antarctica.AAC.4